MSLEPRHRPESGHPAAERQFVDREEPIALFQAALKEPQRTEPLVIVFHGGAGIGKSRLRQELMRLVDRRQKTEDGGRETVDRAVVAAALDFAIPSYRQPESALFFLRNALRDAYQVRFPSFDLAYAAHWQKTHPDTAMRSVDSRQETVDRADPGGKEGIERQRDQETIGWLEPGSLLSQLLDESVKLPLIGLIPRISKLLAASLDPSTTRPLDHFLRTWWTERGERELEDLPQMEPAAIVECLPKLWAADLKEFIVHRSSFIVGRKAVLFVDSYEKLWETGSTEAEFFKRDAWVRELVKQLPEVLWVISGRQKLRWEEVEKEWADILKQHELGALPEHSAREFLSSCGITDEPMQDAIAKGSQGLPHYLNLAVDTFLEIRQAGQRVLAEAESASTPEEVFAQFIRHLDQPVIETLEILSASRFWNYGLFEHLVTEYQTGYPLTAYDDLSWFSFVGEGTAPETRTMHELMREALQEHQAPELRKRVHLFLHELYAKQLEGLEVKGITEKHKAALTEAFYHGRQAKSAEELWTWFVVAFDVFEKAGLYRLLIPLSREIVQSLETELGPNHPSVAESTFRLASQLLEQGEYDKAEPLFRRALAIFEREHGPKHELVCDCLVWLSRLLTERARYDEAEVLCRRAVGVSDKPGSAVLLRWEAVSNLAVVLIREQKYTEAEEFARRALAISEKELGPDHRYTANGLNTLAGLFSTQGRHAEAEPLLRRALAINEKNLGANHPRVTLPLNGLAYALYGLCRYAEAEPLLRRALRLREETLGPDHPLTIVSVNNLGFLLRDQGRYAEAEPLLRRALALHEKKLGSDHPNTVAMAGNLIGVLVRQGKYAEAEPMVLSAIATCEKKFGPDHAKTTCVLLWAGMMYSNQGRYNEAEGYVRRVLDTRTRVLGPRHPDTLTAQHNFANLEERRGRYAEAESLYRDVMGKRERVQGPDHPDLAATTYWLAGICSRDGRNAEAEALYRRALAIREKVFGPDHSFTAETLEGLAKVYEQTGRAAEAQELSARAQRIRAQAEPAPTNPQQI